MHFLRRRLHFIEARVIGTLVAILCCSLCALPAQAVKISSPSYPFAVFHDFSDATIPFAAYVPPGGVLGSVPSGARFEIENGALKITNAYAGSFGIDTKIKAFDADKFGHLYFDYELSPQVKVNIFFRVKGKYHGAIFSGPERVRPGSVLLGKIADVQADGKWHRAYIPLREWLRTIYPTDEQLMVEEIIIGNWDNSGWLMAGMGGNSPGAQWRMDNFAIVGAGLEDGLFTLNDDNGQPLPKADDYRWSLDEKLLPPAGSTLKVAEHGFHILRVLDNKLKPLDAVPLLATTGPRIGAVSLHDNELVATIEAAAGLDTKDLKLTVGDRSFDRTSPFLSWNGAQSTLTLDAARAGLSWPDGQKLDVEISGIKDTLGRGVANKTAAVTVDYARHEAAPPAHEILSLTGEMGDGTFEESLDEWSNRDEGGAIVERDNTTAASGQCSLRLTNPANASPFATWVRRTPFDAAKYPIISFDYRVPPDLRVDFVLTIEGRTYSIQFTDSDNPRPRLGTIPDIIADNKWHHAEIKLLEMLRAVIPAASGYRVDSLALMDEKWLGNARGLQYWIDNFQFVPRIADKPFQIEPQLKDVTGLKAISWVLDNHPETIPDAKPAPTTQSGFSGRSRSWLHVRAQNGAGKWGPTAHFPLLLENQTP